MLLKNNKKQENQLLKHLAEKFEKLMNTESINARIKEKMSQYLKGESILPIFSLEDGDKKLTEDIINTISNEVIKEISNKIHEEISLNIKQESSDVLKKEKQVLYYPSKKFEDEEKMDGDKPSPILNFDAPYSPTPFYFRKPDLYAASGTTRYSIAYSKYDNCEKNSISTSYTNTSPIFEIVNLTASINNITILKNFNLKIYRGEIHVIMGRNGSGKSTLSKIIAGHPAYKVISGDILYQGQTILNLEPEERSHLGIFLAFQYPIEIPGVSNEDFLRLAYNAKMKHQNQPEIDPIKFLELISHKLKIVKMNPTFLARNVNEGFSGGEKKRNEILQMALLDSQLSILDETDSGLDIDALKIIANGISGLMNENKAMILITHYQRLLEYVKPDFVHIIQNGTIIKTGNFNLAKELELTGYAN
jgi:Fe-S cluster assembly ATP-binding protein